jgi:ABC-type transport system involved in cytochrome bd biosynthesis fused ATPase/permease subunit
LRSIIDFDKVLVLDAGEVKEYDHPHILLQKEDSIFRAMVEQSGEMEILVGLARAAYKKNLLVDTES